MRFEDNRGSVPGPEMQWESMQEVLTENVPPGIGHCMHALRPDVCA